EQSNLRNALDWFLGGAHRAQEYQAGEATNAADVDSAMELEQGLRLATALGEYWHLRGYHQEGREWLEKGLAATHATNVGSHISASVRAKAVNQHGFLACCQGDWTSSRASLEMCIKLYTELGDAESRAATM